MNIFKLRIGIEAASDIDKDELEDEIESTMAAVEVADKEVQSAIDTGEQLAEDTNSLEDIEEYANEAHANGGLTGQALAVLNKSSGDLCNRWGVKVAFVATESAGADLDSTKMACEAIKDAMYSVWERFISWYAWLRTKVKETVIKLTNAGKTLRKKAAKIETRLGEGLGELKADKKTISGSWLTDGSYDGTFNAAQCLAVSTSATAEGKTLAVAVAAMTNDATSIISSNDANKEGGGESKVDAAIKSLGVKSKAKLKGAVPKRAILGTCKALPANAYLISWTMAAGGPEETRFLPTGESSTTKDIAPASAAEIGTYATAIDTIGEALEATLKNFGPLEKAENDLAKEMATTLKDLKSAKVEDRPALRDAKNAAQRNLRKTTAARSAYEFTLRRAGTALYGYAVASLAAYSKPE